MDCFPGFSRGALWVSCCISSRCGVMKDFFCVKVSPIHCLTLDKRKEARLPNENRDMRWSSLTENKRSISFLSFFFSSQGLPSFGLVSNGPQMVLRIVCSFTAILCGRIHALVWNKATSEKLHSHSSVDFWRKGHSIATLPFPGQ